MALQAASSSKRNVFLLVLGVIIFVITAIYVLRKRTLLTEDGFPIGFYYDETLPETNLYTIEEEKVVTFLYPTKSSTANTGVELKKRNAKVIGGETVDPVDSKTTKKAKAKKKSVGGSEKNSRIIPLNDEPYYSSVSEEKVSMKRPPKIKDSNTRTVDVYDVTKPIVTGTSFSVSAIIPPFNAQKDTPRITMELTTEDTENKYLHCDLRIWMSKVYCNTKKGDWSTKNEGIFNVKPLAQGSKVTMKLTVSESSYIIHVDDVELGAYQNRIKGSEEKKELVHFILVGTIPLDKPVLPAGIIEENSSKSEEVEEYANYNLLQKGVKYSVFVGVLSSPNNFLHRWSIRKSWLNYPQVREKKYLVRFFVARSENKEIMELLQEEQNKFGDLVLLSHVDSYRSVGYKTLGMCQYASKLDVKYLFKCDDDTFLRMDELESKLNSVQSSKAIYLGSISYNSGPHRDPNSKWFVTVEEYGPHVYPPFAHGPGYIVSRELFTHISDLYDKKQLRVLVLEDVGMATWVDDAVKKYGLQVEYINEHRFDAGSCANNMISGHYIEPDRHIRIYKKILTNSNPICE